MHVLITSTKGKIIIHLSETTINLLQTKLYLSIIYVIVGASIIILNRQRFFFCLLSLELAMIDLYYIAQDFAFLYFYLLLLFFLLTRVIGFIIYMTYFIQYRTSSVMLST